MAAPIDFYFDFSSPYGYLAAQKIEALAEKHGRAPPLPPALGDFCILRIGPASV